MKTIDGQYGEGGGQILRTSLSLAAVTQQTLTIKHIRGRRSKPGLMAQHLTACRAVCEITQGKLSGAELGSLELIYEPSGCYAGEYEFDIGTAGSITLVAQTIIPILINAKGRSKVRLIGGTHLIQSPGYDYFANVFIPAISVFGAKVETKLLRCGYYPKGGGMVELTVQPSTLYANQKWDIDDNVHALIRLSRLPEHIAQREQQILKQHGITECQITQGNTYSPGNAITIWQGFKGANSIGERGKPAEKVAQQAIDDFNIEQYDIDKHLADQLLIYATLADDETVYQTSEITSHCQTNAYVIEQLTNRKIIFKQKEIRVGYKT